MILHKRNLIFTITILVSLFFVFSLVSCRALREKAKEKEKEKAGTEIETEDVVVYDCTDFSGKWDTNLGDLEISQKGCDADGTLIGTGGGAYKIEGTVTDETFDFEWKGPKGRGMGYFKMDESGDKFVGETGEGEENTGQSKWDGERMM